MVSTATPTLLSAGPVLFAPDVSTDGVAVLFAADIARATIFAFEIPAETPATDGAAVEVSQLGSKVASLLGVDREDVVIRGMTVHPVSHAVYLSVARGRGAEAGPAVVRVGTDGQLSVVELDDLPVTPFKLDDAPAIDDERLDAWLDGTDSTSEQLEIHGTTLNIARVPAQRSTVTGLAWVDGTLFVAGLSNEEFSSRLRRVDYPFDGSATATSVEIFHVDHGKYETQSPIRALTSFAGGSSILASYTCTPVVQFSVDQLRGEGLVRGRTVAELGPMNQPFSIVSYDRDGEEFLLVSNTRHPLLKIPAAAVVSQSPLSVPMSEPDHSLGVPREELEYPGITWMASLDRESIVAVQLADGDSNLRTFRAADLTDIHAFWVEGAIVLAGSGDSNRLSVVPVDALYLGPDVVATAGTWARSNSEARFTPRFPAVAGTDFAVIEWLDDDGAWRELARVTVPGTDRTPRTKAESIDPDIEVVPANLLRFAVAFSAEIEEGSAAGHIRLLDENGAVLPGALLEMPPELWDRDHRRLTVLLEPGRIKRGLQPHVQAGPPLRDGGTVTLVVESAIRDADGSPLIEDAHRTYRVGPPIRSRVDPALWEVRWPDAPSEPLVVRFDRPLDRALVRRYLQVLDARERAVAGRATLDETAELWMFTPAVQGADFTNWVVRVDSRLEDVAGNSVRRVLDRDLAVPEDDGIEDLEVILTRAGDSCSQ